MSVPEGLAPPGAALAGAGVRTHPDGVTTPTKEPPVVPSGISEDAKGDPTKAVPPPLFAPPRPDGVEPLLPAPGGVDPVLGDEGDTHRTPSDDRGDRG